MNKGIIDNLSEIRWKPILIPPEHGIWGFVIESMILGLFFSEGISRNIIAFTMILLPFARQSFKILAQDVVLKRNFFRKYVVLVINLLFLSLFTICFYIIFINSIYNYWIVPYLFSFLLGLILVTLEIKGYYQHLLVEISSSFLPFLMAISMHLTSEYQSEILLFMFTIVTFRNITSILLIREIVAKIKKQNYNTYLFYAAVFISFIFALFLNSNYIISKFIMGFMFIYLLIFVALFLKPPRKIQTLGWFQLFLGILLILVSVNFRN